MLSPINNTGIEYKEVGDKPSFKQKSLQYVEISSASLCDPLRLNSPILGFREISLKSTTFPIVNRNSKIKNSCYNFRNFAPLKNAQAIYTFG
jgi:hypothetical protein